MPNHDLKVRLEIFSRLGGGYSWNLDETKEYTVKLVKTAEETVREFWHRTFETIKETPPLTGLVVTVGILRLVVFLIWVIAP